ncbi:MAG: hypothetical protein EPO32_04310 [Anaerolineae bacterium]|nr:MAG: hypothetical protein EPO32_04310 [Anaerolineae bacterium]
MPGILFRRIRIFQISDPQSRGVLDQFHDFRIEVELDPGEPYAIEKKLVVVSLFDDAYYALSSREINDPKRVIEEKARIAHYVSTHIVSRSPQELVSLFPLQMQVSVEDVRRLQTVDPERVEIQTWHEIKVAKEPEGRRVFISCGQSTEYEKNLGETISRRVKEQTGLDGYFAQNQQSLEGLTQNIFNAIHNADGFIAVMHRRDNLDGKREEYRGSVWVEQEIAIAAFMVQSLGLRLPFRVYVQKGIRREGVRGFILLNPKEFEKDEEVLTDLEGFWPELLGRV